MRKGLSEILAECIEDVLSGGMTPEESLGRYPKQRKELEPLLYLALELSDLPKDIKPAFSFKVSTRAILARAMEERRPTGFAGLIATTASVIEASSARIWYATNRVATVAASLMLALTVAGAGTVYAAKDTIPGDLLYPVKTATESAQLALAFSEDDKSEVYIKMAESRLIELSSVASKGRVEAAEKLAVEYQESVGHSLEQAKLADTVLPLSRVQEQISKHVALLQSVYNAAPQETQGAVAMALASSRQQVGEPEPALSSGVGREMEPRPAATLPKPIGSPKTAEKPGPGTAPGKVGDSPQVLPAPPVKGLPSEPDSEERVPSKEGTTPDADDPLPITAREGDPTTGAVSLDSDKAQPASEPPTGGGPEPKSAPIDDREEDDFNEVQPVEDKSGDGGMTQGAGGGLGR